MRAAFEQVDANSIRRNHLHGDITASTVRPLDHEMSARLVPFAALICIVMMPHANSVMADEPVSMPDVTSSVEATPSVQEVPVPLTPEQLEKKKKAYIGLVAVAGIVVIGVALSALTILWAGRLRRQLRRSDPACAPLDRSFWFLKPPKRLVTRSSLPEQQRAADGPPPNTLPDSDSP
ncbi:MAG: hypothetical protein DWH84_03835 [Planctomycetota bacterium]|nr:MAG: hypothetical protein DWH84_03835 [Planctomycetota bacterium]